MTTRRDALKFTALAAAPIAALVPAAALATDASAARLAQIEDERALASLVRAFLRRFNGSGADDCGEFVASSGAIRIDAAIDAIATDPAADPVIVFAQDGRSASWRSAAQVQLVSRFDGDSTLEKMARFQGSAGARATASRTLDAEFARTPAGWTITRLALA